MRSTFRRRTTPCCDYRDQSPSPIHVEAIAIIRACIEGVRWATRLSLSEQGSADAHAAADHFAQDVRAWLGAVRRASEKRWRLSEAWQFAFRPHLALIVGPTSHSELGHAASQAGYQLLAHEFRVLFGNYTPLQPGLSGPELTEQDGVDAVRAAILHALPPNMRGSDAASQLLGVVVRLAEVRGIDGEAAAHLAALNQLAASHVNG